MNSKRRNVLKIGFLNLTAIVALMLSLFGTAMASTNKDVILVLDTSMSMVGSGGENIMPDVKSSIGRYIDGLNDGDRVTFVTFDSDVKVYPEILLDDKNDRDILKKYISVTEAKGKWTHTLKMLNKVFSLAEGISGSKSNEKDGEKDAKESNDRKMVIIIMTDGLDDPPPGKKGSKFNLKNIAEQHSGNDWWIYLVDLADLKGSEKLKKAQAKLKGELSKVSKDTQIISGTDPDSAINKKIQEDIDNKERNELVITILIWFLVILLILLIIFFIYRRRKSLRPDGILEYWNHELLKPEVLAVDLMRYDSNVVHIGRVPGCHLKLREFESRGIVELKAVRVKGEVKVQLSVPEGVDFHYKNKEDDSYLNFGDIFQIENYSFRFTQKEEVEEVSEEK